MSTESENVFRQLFRNWNDRSNRTTTSSTSNRPVLSEWTDYFKTGANDLYNRLPSSVQDIGATNNNVQEPSWYNLSRLERLIGFGCCLGASVLCFVLCFFMLPVLALRPRKFGLLWTGGSVLLLYHLVFYRGHIITFDIYFLEIGYCLQGYSFHLCFNNLLGLYFEK